MVYTRNNIFHSFTTNKSRGLLKFGHSNMYQKWAICTESKKNKYKQPHLLKIGVRRKITKHLNHKNAQFLWLLSFNASQPDLP